MTPATPPTPERRWAVPLAMLAVYLVWGSTYLGIRVVVTTGAPPLLTMGLRFVLAGLVVAGVLVGRHGPRALRSTRAELLGSLVVGVLLLLVGNGLVSIAELHVASGMAALLVATTPLWLVLIAAVCGQAPRRATWVGAVVGFVGTAALAGPVHGGGNAPGWGGALIVAGTFGWALGSFSSGRLAMPADPFVSVAQQMMFGGAAMCLIGLLHGDRLDLAAYPASAWFAWAYLVVFGSLVAYSCYYWLLRNAPLALVSTYAYVNPVVAVVLGRLILDERAGLMEFVGGVLALAGVGIVITSEHSAKG